jgi:chromosome segregation ATPase
MSNLIEQYEADRLAIIQELNECRKTCQQLEKLIELNLKDLWDIADQRDWYWHQYEKLKEKGANH